MVTGLEGEKAPALQLETLLALGLDQRTAENALVNSKVTANLAAVIAEAGISGCDKSVGNLLYAVATKHPNSALVHRPALINYIVSTKIKSPAQLDAALSFLSNVGPEYLDIGKFEEACGVGVVVSIEDIHSTVAGILKENMEAILEQRYHINVGSLCGQVRKKHPWGDAKATKDEIEKRLTEILGPKTEADNVKPVKKKKEKPAKVEEKKVAVATAAPPSEEELNPYTIFPQPAENNKVHTEIFFSDGNIWRAHNTKEILEKHLIETGGKVMTRFPPEPNGYLHIGHAKAMFIDFGLAKERDGHCYLRFDDTNPEAEKKEYIDHIQEIVQWMGWEPYKVTYTSDYFQALYEHAVELIRKGLAYVDHQTGEQIKEYREKKMDSPWRNRPTEESLQLFEDMRRGLIAEGAATLRMKQDMQNDNKNMSDLIAYRIKFTPHPHAGDKWCIYPSYDYAHCMVDSFENITHSVDTMDPYDYEVAILVPSKKAVETIDISSSSEGDDGALDRVHVKQEEADDAASMDCATEHEEVAPPPPADVHLTRRGPRIEAGEEWDDFCMYPNLVEMNPTQVDTLRYLVDQKRPAIPFYVCTIKSASTVEGCSRMYFNRKFTKKYISTNMQLPENDFLVSYSERHGVKVRIFQGKGKFDGAVITTNWSAVVRKSKMKANDIFVFWFRIRARGGLKLYVRKLEK